MKSSRVKSLRVAPLDSETHVERELSATVHARLRVLFDARPSASGTGIGRYAASTARLLRSGCLGVDFAVLGGSAPDLELRAGSVREEALELPALLARERIDVFHSALFHLPPVLPPRTRAVVTIHDAIPGVCPEYCQPRFAREFVRARAAAARAAIVVCPSESARRDIARALDIPTEKIRVIPEAPDPVFRAVDPAAVRDVQERYGLRGPFLLVVGALEPRKDPTVVLEALAILEDTEIGVVYAGPPAGLDVAAAAEARSLTDRVWTLGHVPDADLVGLYNAAAARVFPSRYEGFGLPVVEAFACGTPVIASNAGSIPEVAGNGALLVDPGKPQELAEAIERVLGSARLREDLRRMGCERLQRYSPDVIRREFAALYRTWYAHC